MACQLQVVRGKWSPTFLVIPHPHSPSNQAPLLWLSLAFSELQHEAHHMTGWGWGAGGAKGRGLKYPQTLQLTALSPQYGIVLDAGSSHTSMFVYKWPADKENNTGIVGQHSSCDVQGEVPKH